MNDEAGVPPLVSDAEFREWLAVRLVTLQAVLVGRGLTTNEEVERVHQSAAAQREQFLAACREKLLAENPGMAHLMRILGGEV
jgi:hypothetical protein